MWTVHTISVLQLVLFSTETQTFYLQFPDYCLWFHFYLVRQNWHLRSYHSSCFLLPNFVCWLLRNWNFQLLWSKIRLASSNGDFYIISRITITWFLVIIFKQWKVIFNGLWLLNNHSWCSQCPQQMLAIAHIRHFDYGTWSQGFGCIQRLTFYTRILGRLYDRPCTHSLPYSHSCSLVILQYHFRVSFRLINSLPRFISFPLQVITQFSMHLLPFLILLTGMVFLNLWLRRSVALGLVSPCLLTISLKPFFTACIFTFQTSPNWGNHDSLNGLTMLSNRAVRLKTQPAAKHLEITIASWGQLFAHHARDWRMLHPSQNWVTSLIRQRQPIVLVPWKGRFTYSLPF